MSKKKLDIDVEDYVDNIEVDVIESIESVESVESVEIKSIEFEQIKVVSNKAILREFPKHDVRPMGKVAIGSDYNVLDKVEGSYVANSNLWYKILVSGKGLYIHSSYVALL